MTDLTSMRNIGKELERKLKLAGIESAEELMTIGSKEAYFELKLRSLRYAPCICMRFKEQSTT